MGKMYSELALNNATQAKRILNMKTFIRKLCSLRFQPFNIGDHFSSWNDPTNGGNSEFEKTRTK